MKELKVKNLNKKCEEFFKDYPEFSSVSTQVLWLRSHVLDDIDPELYGCILNRHQITKDTHEDLIANYWGEERPVYTEIKIQSIKNDYFSFPINYDFFISFPLDMNKKISHHLVGNFTLKPSCYSLPFMEAIYRKYKKTAILVFTMGRHYDKDCLVFSIKGSTESYYDFSQIPPLYPPEEPLAV